MNDELKKALAKITAAHEDRPSAPADAGVPASAFPVVHRQSLHNPWSIPIRRGIDYQSRPQKVFLFCRECRGVLEAPDAHEKDPALCDLERVRQVMEG